MIARFLKLAPMANPRTMASNAVDEMTMIDSFFLRVVTEEEGNGAAVAASMMLLSVVMMLNVDVDVVLRNQSNAMAVAGSCRKNDTYPDPAVCMPDCEERKILDLIFPKN